MSGHDSGFKGKCEEMIEELEEYIKRLRVWASMRCFVCGGEMTFAASGRDGTKYVCKKAAEGALKHKWGTEEERENTNHYHESSSHNRKTNTMSVFNGVANDLEKIIQRSEGKVCGKA